MPWYKHVVMSDVDRSAEFSFCVGKCLIQQEGRERWKRILITFNGALRKVLLGSIADISCWVASLPKGSWILVSEP